MGSTSASRCRVGPTLEKPRERPRAARIIEGPVAVPVAVSQACSYGVCGRCTYFFTHDALPISSCKVEEALDLSRRQLAGEPAIRTNLLIGQELNRHESRP